MGTEVKKNKKMLLILIPAVILLLIIGASKIISAKKSEKVDTANKKTQSFVDPDLDYSTDTIKNKSDVYRVGDEKKEEEEEIKKKSSINLDQLGNMADENKKTSEGGFETLDNSTNKKEENKNITNDQKTKTQNVRVVNRDVPTHKKSGKIESEPKKEVETQGGMGIYVASSGSKEGGNSNKTNSFRSDEDSYLPAILEEDTKVKENTNLVFILYKDCYIQDVKFKKNSVIYATAYSGNSSFDVIAYTIKNASDNKKYSVKLALYNENLSRGIRYEGNLGTAVKEGQRDAMDDASYNLQGTNTATELGTNVVKGTVRSLQRQREVNIRQGYRVNFKILEDNR